MTLLPDTREQLMGAATRQAANGTAAAPQPQAARPDRARPDRARPDGARLAGAVRRRRLAVLFGALVIVAIVVIVLVTGSGGGAGTTIVFRAGATKRQPVTARALRQTMAGMDRRLRTQFVRPFTVDELSGHRIEVTSPDRRERALITAIVTTAPRLTFFDWEADAVTPAGVTVASALAGPGRAAAALRISQGVGGMPGTARGGGLGLYAAVRVAARLAVVLGAHPVLARDEYYLFSAPGGAACGTPRRAATAATSRSRCLLAGPLDVSAHSSRSHALALLRSGLSAQARRGAQILVVKPGTIVLEAAALRYGTAPPFGAPGTRYFVLQNTPALAGGEVTRAAPVIGLNGITALGVTLSSQGGAALQSLTVALAQRGAVLSTIRRSAEQHFAVAIGRQLITVAAIDFRAYPNGLNAGDNATVLAGFTPRSAAALAARLRLRDFPLKLTALPER